MQVNPRARRLAREKAIQYLFGLGFTSDEPNADGLMSFWEAFPSKPSVRDYAEKLIDGARNRQETLDSHIDSALNNWAASRVGRVERNILRVALYEMAFCDDVPEKVAINEAIDLAKLLGGDDSPRFVNGVLDRLKGVELGGDSA